jgi:outer membrane protein, adhesin transport system
MKLRVLVCVCALLAAGSPAYAMSLRDAVQKAVSQHPSVGAARANERARVWDFKAAKSRLMPSVDFSGDAGGQFVNQPANLTPDEDAQWDFRRQINGEITQVLFDGWERANDIYRSAASVDAAALRLLERSEALALDAVEAYIDVQRHSQILGIAQQNRKRLLSIQSLVQELNDGGKVPASDVNQAHERIAAADAIIAQIEQALADAKAKFRQVIGIEPGKLQKVDYPGNLPRSQDAAYNTALENNPAIQAFGAEAQAAYFAKEQAKGAYYPTISLRGRGSYGYNIDGVEGEDVDLTGLVVFSWNIFNGGATEARSMALGEELTRTRLEQEAAARTVRETIDKTFAAYIIGQQRVSAAQRQVNSNDQLVKQYREEYKLAKRSLLDLLDSESALFNSQFQLTSVKAVRLFSAYHLQAATGRLLASLGVQAPAEANVQVPDLSSTSIFKIDIEPLRQD